MRYRTLTAIGLILSASVTAARGDTIQLVNGDTISGEVLSLDGKELKLRSELLGEIAIARDKVGRISFGDRPLEVAAPQPALPAGNALLPNSGTLPAAGTPATPEELLRQLQKEGVDPKAIGDVQKAFPLLQTPEAQKYFNDTVGGLMSGRIGIQDIRKDAVKARNELKDLQKELGPEGAALNGYLQILDSFIQDTEPERDTADGAAPSDEKSP